MDECQQPRLQAPKHQFGSQMKEREMRLTVNQKVIVHVNVSSDLQKQRQQSDFLPFFYYYYF